MGALGDFGRGWLKGGIPGGIGGVLAGREQRKAEDIQQGAMDEAIQRQEQLRQEMDARRQRDLANTMGFYTPALQALEHLYGIPTSAWGQGLPQNQAPPPARTAGGWTGFKVDPRTPTVGGMSDMTSSGPRPIQGLQRAPFSPLGPMLKRGR